MTFKKVSAKRWVKRAEKQLPAMPLVLLVSNQQLWCCCGDAGIVVFDNNFQQQRIVRACASYVYDVAEMSNGDVVIASADGLYHTSRGK